MLLRQFWLITSILFSAGAEQTRYENAGSTVDLIITTRSKEEAKEIATFLENVHFSYSVKVVQDVITDGEAVGGEVNLRVQEEKVTDTVRVNNDQMEKQTENQTQVNELSQIAVKKKEEELKSALKENQTRRNKGEGNLEKTDKIYELILALLEEKTVLQEQLQKVDSQRQEELKNALKNKAELEEKLQTQATKVNETMINLEQHLKSLNKKACASGWTHSCFFNNCSCYRLFTEKKSWYDASASCKQYGSELASIHSHDEDAFIGKLANENSPWTTYTWIGLNDHAKEGSFQWSDGTPVDFLGWDKGQPYNLNPNNEDCVLTRNTGKWHDYWCEGDVNYYSYLCKRTLQ